MPRLFLFFICLFIACHKEEASKQTKIEEPMKQVFMQTNMPDPQVSGLFVAPSEVIRSRFINRADLQPQIALEPATTDILSNVGINLVIEMADESGISEDAIRAAADVSYKRLGIADQSLRGWTLSVRQTQDNTSAITFDPTNKLIIMITDAFMIPYTGPHEMTHVLMGRVSINAYIPGVMGEFVATAAEIYQPTDPNQITFTYEALNRPILATAKNIVGRSDVISAYNAPLDGPRYDLLRAAGKKIGDDKYRQLAKAVYDKATRAKQPMKLDDFAPVFTEYGLGDCVLFIHVIEPGFYMDLTVTESKMPVVFTKYIDGAGRETIIQAPFSFLWKKDGKPVRETTGLVTPAFVDVSSASIASSMDEYVLTVGNITHTYTIR